MINSEDIWTKIEDGMAEYISSMTLAGGYYYDWGSVNENDVNKQKFPSAEIMMDNEDNIDDEGGIDSNSYLNKAVAVIRIRCEKENKTDHPKFAINRDLNRALADIKRLFGTYQTVTDQCETIMYAGSVKIFDKRNDVFRPKYIDVTFNIQYFQKRTDPSIFTS